MAGPISEQMATAHAWFANINGAGFEPDLAASILDWKVAHDALVAALAKFIEWTACNCSTGMGTRLGECVWCEGKVALARARGEAS